MTESTWPQPTRENRPWTRWWWLGSALNEAEITRHLELFQQAGIGGVEISPIYGAKGFDDRYVDYLSDRWIALLAFTLAEADRLGLGVDMILGTGWPYGGPWVSDANAPQRMYWEKIPFRAKLPEAAPGRRLLATGTPDKSGNRLVLLIGPTGQQVKRAAPSGEGNVVDPLNASAVREYLAAFDDPLSRLPTSPKLRCIFNDSYEVFGANTTLDIFREFANRRGYDLADCLASLHGEDEPDTVRRVRSDYRETIGDLVLDAFISPWTAWAHSKGLRSRNQAHGSPGNLLDLYAAADIPETEVFGPPRLKLGGLKALRPAPPDFGEEEEALVCKMASSAAHVAGRPLCSSECFTWAGEHGCVPLEHLKAEVDTLLTLGINHIFFHGTPFSPVDAPWPGWLFYATTHMAPTNPWWSSLPVLNAYIARCQSFLQAGQPDNDLLVYFPYYDLIASDHGAVDGLQFMTVGRTKTWLRDNLPGFVQTTHDLTEGGWSFDFVSDRQLEANVDADTRGVATTGGARYRAILVTGCHLMPPSTLERIVALAEAGATVLVLGDLPADVPGRAALEARRARLFSASAAFGSTARGVRQTDVCLGRIVAGQSLNDLLEAVEIRQEPIAAHGIEHIRRVDSDGARTYFLANPGRDDWNGWVAFVQGSDSSRLLDPMTGTIYSAPSRPGAEESTEIYLEIPSGASLIVQPLDAISGIEQPIAAADEPGVEIDGPWRVEFLEGGPTFPASREITRLADWTTWTAPDSEALRAFSGTARYSCHFDAPKFGADGCFVDLGEVCHSAKVRLNGGDLGTVIARPWRIFVPATLLRASGNALEIEVTNLMANRLADLERREGDAWRPFLMVNIAYKPFDAASWEPLPSGLIGPVRLVGDRATRREASYSPAPLS